MKDTRPRKERRANPDRWFRICAYFDPEKDRVVELEENASGAVCIKGSIDDVIVVQVPDMTPSEQVKMLKGVQAALEGAGVDKPVVLLPHWVKLVKFRPIDDATSDKLDKHSRMKAAEASAKEKFTKH